MKKIFLLLLCCFMLGAGYAWFHWNQDKADHNAIVPTIAINPESIFTQEAVTPVQVAEAACQALLDGNYTFFNRVSLPQPTGIDYAVSWEGLSVQRAVSASLNQTPTTGRYVVTMNVASSGKSPFPAGEKTYILETSVEPVWKHPVIKTFIPEEKWINPVAWTPSNAKYNPSSKVLFFRTFGSLEPFASTDELDKTLMLELSIYFASREKPRVLENSFFDQTTRDEAPPKGITGYTQEEVDAASRKHFGLTDLTKIDSPLYNKTTGQYQLATQPGRVLNERLVSHTEKSNGTARCTFESYADPLQTVVDSSTTYLLTKNADNTWCLVSATAAPLSK